MAAALPGAIFVPIEDPGHAPITSYPRQVVKAIEGHFTQDRMMTIDDKKLSSSAPRFPQ